MTLLPIVLILVAIPLSMLLWVGNVAFTVFWTGQNEAVAPTQWLMSILTPVLIAASGLKKRTISISGLFVGFVLDSKQLFIPGFSLYFLCYFIKSYKVPW